MNARAKETSVTHVAIAGLVNTAKVRESGLACVRKSREADIRVERADLVLAYVPR